MAHRGRPRPGRLRRSPRQFRVQTEIRPTHSYIRGQPSLRCRPPPLPPAGAPPAADARPVPPPRPAQPVPPTASGVQQAAPSKQPPSRSRPARPLLLPRDLDAADSPLAAAQHEEPPVQQVTAPGTASSDVTLTLFRYAPPSAMARRAADLLGASPGRGQQVSHRRQPARPPAPPRTCGTSATAAASVPSSRSRSSPWPKSARLAALTRGSSAAPVHERGHVLGQHPLRPRRGRPLGAGPLQLLDLGSASGT